MQMRPPKSGPSLPVVPVVGGMLPNCDVTTPLAARSFLLPGAIPETPGARLRLRSNSGSPTASPPKYLAGVQRLGLGYPTGAPSRAPWDLPGDALAAPLPKEEAAK